MAQWPRYTPTRFRYIGLSKIQNGLWRYVSLDWEGGGTTKDNPSVIGPAFATKAEALVELEAYGQANYPGMRS